MLCVVDLYSNPMKLGMQSMLSHIPRPPCRLMGKRQLLQILGPNVKHPFHSKDIHC